ncbi:hypothetical protein CHUAL_004512 [Chamberlinius hualienensis]
MIIKNSDARRGFLSKQKEILMKEELQTSVWTIDLVYILKTLNIECWYYTETVGVNHDYKDEPYYRQSIDADTLRVTKKFNDAESNGIRVSRRVLTLKNILCHLETDPIIALLDAKYAICCEITHSHKVLLGFKENRSQTQLKWRHPAHFQLSIEKSLTTFLTTIYRLVKSYRPVYFASFQAYLNLHLTMVLIVFS